MTGKMEGNSNSPLLAPSDSPMQPPQRATLSRQAMGRKRNQGKARKAAAKAKARKEEEERERAEDGLQHNEREQAEQLQQLPFASETDTQEQFQVEIQKPPPSQLQCIHGSQCVSLDDAPYLLTEAFLLSFYDANNGAVERGRSILDSLLDALQATSDEFAAVWGDSAMMEMTISCYLRSGTNAICVGHYDHARLYAVFARFFEQYIAAELKQTQALINWPKICEANNADLHTLVKFFRHRIPCSCLDEQYDKVKSITKMAFCWNPKCKIAGRKVERSKTKYCSRCRGATYCSRECQETDWSRHKSHCDYDAAAITKFEVKKQSSVAKFAERESSSSAAAKSTKTKLLAKKAKMKKRSKPKAFATPSDEDEVKIPGVSTDKIKAKIESIVANADKDSFTVKDVREELEDWLDMNLAEYKESIRTLVMDVM